MAESTAPSRKRARQETPREEASQAATLMAILTAMQSLREDQERIEARQTAGLQRLEEEILRIRPTLSQLSPSNNFASVEVGARSGEAGASAMCVGAGDRVAGAWGQGDARSGVNLKLKPDTFDGTVPLREYLCQFDLIARANGWDDASKAVALASCLRGKARAILESLEGQACLEFAELRAKLELRFGETQSTHNFYSLFTNRRQKFGEDLAALGADLERLSRLAYPECPYEVREKIACAQFVSALTDGFVRRTLQLEGVTSLGRAIERAKAVKAIQDGNSEKRRENYFGRQNGGGRQDGAKEEVGKTDDAGRGVKGKGKSRQGGGNSAGRRECWGCGKVGHFRSECPDGKGNGA